MPTTSIYDQAVLAAQSKLAAAQQAVQQGIRGANGRVITAQRDLNAALKAQAAGGGAVVGNSTASRAQSVGTRSTPLLQNAAIVSNNLDPLVAAQTTAMTALDAYRANPTKATFMAMADVLPQTDPTAYVQGASNNTTLDRQQRDPLSQLGTQSIAKSGFDSNAIQVAVNDAIQRGFIKDPMADTPLESAVRIGITALGAYGALSGLAGGGELLGMGSSAGGGTTAAGGLGGTGLADVTAGGFATNAFGTGAAGVGNGLGVSQGVLQGMAGAGSTLGAATAAAAPAATGALGSSLLGGVTTNLTGTGLVDTAGNALAGTLAAPAATPNLLQQAGNWLTDQAGNLTGTGGGTTGTGAATTGTGSVLNTIGGIAGGIAGANNAVDNVPLLEPNRVALQPLEQDLLAVSQPRLQEQLDLQAQQRAALGGNTGGLTSGEIFRNQLAQRMGQESMGKLALDSRLAAYNLQNQQQGMENAFANQVNAARTRQLTNQITTQDRNLSNVLGGAVSGSQLGSVGGGFLGGLGSVATGIGNLFA